MGASRTACLGRSAAAQNRAVTQNGRIARSILQSNGSRTAVESQSNRSCNQVIRRKLARVRIVSESDVSGCDY